MAYEFNAFMAYEFNAFVAYEFNAFGPMNLMNMSYHALSLGN